ncbi:MAG: FtsX-like permease family protein [Ilumatobacteraceae bacterium]
MILVGFGGGAAVGALVAADRTDRAYLGYVRSASVEGLTVNPSLATVAMDREMRRLPGVHDVHVDWLFAATVSVVGPAPLKNVLSSDDQLQVRGSTDGRYEAVDRPVVTEGRFASGRGEVFVSEDYRAALDQVEHRHLHAGDRIDLAFWWGPIADVGLPLDQVVTPIGVEHVRIAGYGHLADEVLPDELYARRRLIVSQDIAKRYACLGELSPEMTLDEALASVYPDDCSTQYPYYSLDVDPGSTSRVKVHAAFEAAVQKLSPMIPKAVAEEGVGYYYVAQDRSDVDRNVANITRPTVAAFVVFGGVAALAVLTVAALVIARMLRLDLAAQATLRALGATRAQRMQFAAGPIAVATAAGLALAIPVAAAMSTVGPVGAVRSVAVAPHRTLALPAAVVVPSLLGMGVVLVLIVVLLGFAAVRRTVAPEQQPLRRNRVVASLRRTARPSAALGVGAAMGARRSDGSLAVLAGCAVAVAAVVAAVVFGANLTGMIHDPDQYGWPWDVAVITGAGYGDTMPDAVAKTLRHDPAVQDYGIFGFDSSITFEGRSVPTVLALPGAGPAPFPVVAGRLATHPGEVVLGGATARRLHLSIGDDVTVGSPVGDLPTEVVGIVAMPYLGSFLADRTGLGEGAFMPIAFDPEPGSPDQFPGTLTAIRLRPGTDAAKFLARIQPKLQGWDANGAPPTATHAAAVRPPAIINAGTIRVAPLALGGILGVGLAIGMALSIGVSVRDRRRELAIVRALGFRRSDVRATVVWQAMAIVAVGLVVGMPLGVIAGRGAWRVFAHQLGVVPSADVSFVALIAVALGSVVLGLLAAAGPIRTAVRIVPSDVLRDTP